MKIVSGGQSGVDRAALDSAIALGLEYGGWVPKDGWAEDYPDPPGILPRYPRMRPTADADPAERTRLNARDSDATLILLGGRESVSHGTELTIAIAKQLERPLMLVRADDPAAAPRVRAWLQRLPHDLILNVAGPRESEAPGIYQSSRRLLEAILSDRARPRAAS
ncbi:MAG TPA: putative molybdenum carrier protein [Candidatus Binataceae bacterium]|nr:putative molybdenum carrier protein [Candidatus Binataceae bacterium]